MPTISGVPSCEKPGCHEDPEKTYKGKHGNQLRLCGKHYYKLVTRGDSETSPIGLGTDTLTGGATIREPPENTLFGQDRDVIQSPKMDVPEGKSSE